MILSKRMDLIDSSGIRKVFDLGQKLKNPVNLSIGQPDFDVPNPIKQDAISAIQEGHNKYTLTGGMPELKDKILKKLDTDKGKSFDDIMITSGVSGGLFLSLLVLIDPGDEVLIPDPYFVSYKHIVNFVGGKPIYLDTYPNFKLTKELLKSSITDKTKVLLLNSPGNPTGTVYTKDELQEIVDVLKEKNILVISDEIYELFVYDIDYTSIANLYSNVLLLGGFSKTLSMTGWRIGYAAGPSEILKAMITLQQYTFVCAPSFAQKAILNHIDHDMSDEIINYKRKKKIVSQGLRNEFDLKPSHGAFYLFPKVPYGNDMSFVEKAIANNVLIIPGSVFSEKDTHFRISFATSDDQLKKGVDILNSLCDEE